MLGPIAPLIINPFWLLFAHFAYLMGLVPALLASQIYLILMLPITIKTTYFVPFSYPRVLASGGILGLVSGWLAMSIYNVIFPASYPGFFEKIPTWIGFLSGVVVGIVAALFIVTSWAKNK